MEADGVEGVAYFMSHAGCQQGQRIEPFRLNVFRIALLLGRFVPDEDQVALVFIADGGNENIQEFVLRVEDFHIPGNGGMALLDRVPGAVAAQEDAEGLRRDVFGLLVEELERRLVDEQDFSLAVQQDQPFLDGFEYLLEEALLFRQLDEEALEVLLLDMVDAVDQLVDGVLLHGGAVSLPGLHYV